MEHFGASVHLLHGMCAYYVFLYARLVGASACVCIHHAGMHQILHMWVVTHHPKMAHFVWSVPLARACVDTTYSSMPGLCVLLHVPLRMHGMHTMSQYVGGDPNTTFGVATCGVCIPGRVVYILLHLYGPCGCTTWYTYRSTHTHSRCMDTHTHTSRDHGPVEHYVAPRTVGTTRG
jgi:hypothetical protein